MTGRIIEGEFAAGVDEAIGRAYGELLDLLTDAPAMAAAARAYARGHKRRPYRNAADRAADLAYESRVDADDMVTIIADREAADLRLLSAGEGHPLNGYALDLALAVLAYDQLDPADWRTITEMWVAAGGRLPTMPGQRPARPVRDRPYVMPPVVEEGAEQLRRPPGPAPAARPTPVGRRPAAAPAAPAPPAPVRGRAVPPPPPPAPADDEQQVDPVQLEKLHRAELAKWRRRYRRFAALLWILQAPAFLAAAFLAGWFTSWTPLVIGVFGMITLAVFAVVLGAKAGRR